MVGDLGKSLWSRTILVLFIEKIRDTLVLIQPDNSLLTSVYRNPTHTDLYLQWDSHHYLSAKYSVINTLRHRAKTVCSNHHLLKEEEDHLKRALRNCRYPVWALNRARMNTMDSNKKRTERHMMLPITRSHT